jgi:hypothetical protein
MWSRTPQGLATGPALAIAAKTEMGCALIVVAKARPRAKKFVRR